MQNGKDSMIRVFRSRINRYYRTHGLWGTVLHALLYLKRHTLPEKVIVYVAELAEITNPGDNRAQDLRIERIISADALGELELRALLVQRDPELMRSQIRERFSKGAWLWLAKLDSDVAGMLWSLRQKPLKPYYFPLLERDVHLFDDEVFPEFRGKGINSSLVTSVLTELSMLGSSRAYIETAPWNHAEIKSLSKTPFRELGVARKVRILRRTVTIWYK